MKPKLVTLNAIMRAQRLELKKLRTFRKHSNNATFRAQCELEYFHVRSVLAALKYARELARCI